MTPAERKAVVRALEDAAASAPTEQKESVILGALRKFKSPVSSNSETVIATMNAVREAAQIWGTGSWVLDEVQDALVSGRPVNLVAVRDSRRRSA